MWREEEGARARRREDGRAKANFLAHTIKDIICVCLPLGHNKACWSRLEPCAVSCFVRCFFCSYLSHFPAPPGSRVSGHDAMDSDDEWLAELTSAHRQHDTRGLEAQPSPGPSSQAAAKQAGDEEGDDVSWIEECLLASGKTVLEHAARLELKRASPHDAASEDSLATAAAASSSSASTIGGGSQVVKTWSDLEFRAMGELKLASADEVAFKSFGHVHHFLESWHAPKALAPQPPDQDSILWDALCDCTASPVVAIEKETAPLMHVIARLAMWHCLMGALVFKIGIAADPLSRYHNLCFGYAREGIWRFMDVLLAGYAFRCRAWEISLIRALKDVPGCYNEKPGGEGVAPTRDHRCFLYLVVADAGGGLGLHASVAKRRRQQLCACPLADIMPVARHIPGFGWR